MNEQSMTTLSKIITETIQRSILDRRATIKYGNYEMNELAPHKFNISPPTSLKSLSKNYQIETIHHFRYGFYAIIIL